MGLCPARLRAVLPSREEKAGGQRRLRWPCSLADLLGRPWGTITCSLGQVAPSGQPRNCHWISCGCKTVRHPRRSTMPNTHRLGLLYQGRAGGGRAPENQRSRSQGGQRFSCQASLTPSKYLLHPRLCAGSVTQISFNAHLTEVLPSPFHK